MPKYRIPFIPDAERKRVYTEGKRAFQEGQRRSYNPYSANNLALAAIWWNGWDTGEEERAAQQKSPKR